VINWGAIGVIIIIWIVGFLIAFLGTWASAFRISTQLAIEEMRGTTSATVAQPVATPATGAPTPACPKCGTPLTYVQQYQRWYCPTCREYQ
jgi:NADH pyrophosphatase NudC (nudix superfamily)